jgi:hypothetical protein
VLKVLTKAKNGKAPGIDLIPVELYRNNLLLHVLHKLFNICFKFGKIPSVWCKEIITQYKLSHLLVQLPWVWTSVFHCQHQSYQCSSKTPEGSYFGYSKVRLDYATNILTS